MSRPNDDPETWTALRSQMKEFLNLLAGEEQWPDLTGCVAEMDRSLASMRDAGLSPGQASVFALLTYMKTVRVQIPAFWSLLAAIDPLGPALFTSAVLLEVLDAQS